MLSLGKKKAEVVYNQIKDINPQARIIHTNTGITGEDDANYLADGCDFVIDAMDHGLYRESICYNGRHGIGDYIIFLPGHRIWRHCSGFRTRRYNIGRI